MKPEDIIQTLQLEAHEETVNRYHQRHFDPPSHAIEAHDCGVK